MLSVPADRRAAQAGEPVAVRVDGEAVVLTVQGVLDGPAGEALATAATAAATDDAARLDIDLRLVESFSAEGVAALRACRALGEGLAEGLHFRTGKGPGREALLAAYARSQPQE